MRNRKVVKKKKLLKLKYYRSVYEITADELAEEIGKSPNTYRQKENRRIPFSYDEIILIMDRINRAAEKAGKERHTFEQIFLP